MSKPVTNRQTWALFKLTRKDYRADVASRQVDYDGLYEIIGQTHKVAKANNFSNLDATRAEVERLLANFPAA